MARNQVEIEFLVKQAVTKEITKIEKKLDSLNKKVKKTSKESADSFQKKFGGVASTALGFTFATAIAKASTAVINFGKESVQAGIAFEQQIRALNVQLSSTSDVFLPKLRTATQGLASDLSLVSAANRALALGLNEAQIPELFAAATARAKVLGVSVSSAVNDISTGIGRLSPLILDNLGIVFDSETVYKDYAATIGKTASNLTEFEKKQALTNAVIGSTTVLLDSVELSLNTAADAQERLNASVENFKGSIGGVITDIIAWTTEYDKANIIARQVTSVTGDITIEQKALGKTIKENTAITEAYDESVASLEKRLRGIAEIKFTEEVESERQLVEERLKVAKAEKKLNDIRSGRANPAGDRSDIVNSLAADAKKATEEIKLLEEKLNIFQLERQAGLNKGLGESESTALIIPNTIDLINKKTGDAIEPAEALRLKYAEAIQPLLDQKQGIKDINIELDNQVGQMEYLKSLRSDIVKSYTDEYEAIRRRTNAEPNRFAPVGFQIGLR